MSLVTSGRNRRLGLHGIGAMVAGWLLAGCVTEPPPIVIHEDPNASVWLTFDPEAGKPGHSHPASLTPEQVEKILGGIWVVDRDKLVGRIFHEGEASQALTVRQIKLLVPAIVQAFKKASPVDMVTFYLVGTDPSRGKLITSGGLFVRGDRLYLILANCRTSPSNKIYETTYEFESRDQPLIPVARFLYAAVFKPQAAWIPNGEVRGKDGYERYLDESKLLIIDLKQLSAVPDMSPAPAKPSAPAPRS